MINAFAIIKNMTLNSKIREIITAYGLSDRQFAIRIGVAQSVIGSMFQKGTEPSAKVIKGTLNAFPDISADWFLRDSGEMSVPANSKVSQTSLLLDTIATLQKSLNAKEDAIVALNERIAQLENQIKSK